jgi:hypothetical protein
MSNPWNAARTKRPASQSKRCDSALHPIDLDAIANSFEVSLLHVFSKYKATLFNTGSKHPSEHFPTGHVVVSSSSLVVVVGSIAL